MHAFKDVDIKLSDILSHTTKPNHLSSSKNVGDGDRIVPLESTVITAGIPLLHGSRLSSGVVEGNCSLSGEEDEENDSLEID